MSTVYGDPHRLVARMLRRTVRDESGCWIFTGSVISTGYGSVCAGKKGKSITTHRLMVIARDGSIPEGMTVDHTCHDSYTCTEKPCPHRRCVNPAHLAVVSGADNTARQWERGTCREGHQLSPRKDGRGRRCLTCATTYGVAWRRAQKVA